MVLMVAVAVGLVTVPLAMAVTVVLAEVVAEVVNKAVAAVLGEGAVDLSATAVTVVMAEVEAEGILSRVPAALELFFFSGRRDSDHEIRSCSCRYCS